MGERKPKVNTSPKPLSITHDILRISLLPVIMRYLRSLPAYTTPFMLTKAEITGFRFLKPPKMITQTSHQE